MEIAARVDDLEAPAGEFLTARTVWLADGTPDGLADGWICGSTARSPVITGAGAMPGSTTRSSPDACCTRWPPGGSIPPEVTRLYGDESTSADPYALFDPYQGEPLRDVGAYLSADFDQFTAGLLTGLCWLAGAGIAHRSISPDTVLWDSSAGQVQITDFSRSAPFGIARTPLRGPEAWISPESRPDTCFGMVGPTDDMWGAVRLLYYVRSNGNILTHRGQLADFGLAETFNGLLDKVIGPPESRPTARDLIVDGLRRPYLLPGVPDDRRKWLIAGRAQVPERPGAQVPRRARAAGSGGLLGRRRLADRRRAGSGPHGDPR